MKLWTFFSCFVADPFFDFSGIVLGMSTRISRRKWDDWGNCGVKENPRREKGRELRRRSRPAHFIYYLWKDIMNGESDEEALYTSSTCMDNRTWLWLWWYVLLAEMMVKQKHKCWIHLWCLWWKLNVHFCTFCIFIWQYLDMVWHDSHYDFLKYLASLQCWDILRIPHQHLLDLFS